MEARIERLTHAHRALAARSQATVQIAKVMFALTPAHPATLIQLLADAFDATNTHMDRRGEDREYQRLVRESMDELCEVILSGHQPEPTACAD